MKLLLDLGNSRFKWAMLEDDQLSDMQVAEFENLDAMLQTLPLNQVEEIHVVSVLSDAFHAELEQALNRLDHLPVSFHVSRKENYGVLLAYNKPADFGADRYAGLIAAHHNFPQDKIIIDCGTAVTIDAIDSHGKHLGGMILPGEEMLRRALVDNTQRVFFEDTAHDPNYLNASTSDAVMAGAALSLRHGVWGIIDEIRQKLNQHCVIVTGGNAPRLHHSDYEPYHKHPALVLEGLKIMVNFKDT